MYWLSLGLGLLAGSLLVWRGIDRARIRVSLIGGALLIAVLGFFALMSFWGEALWFGELGYSSRFWRLVLTLSVLGVAGTLVGGGWVFVLARERWAAAAGAVLGLIWWLTQWETVFLFLNGGPTGQQDPIFGRDLGFFLFTLSFYVSLAWFLIIETFLAVVAISIRLLREGVSREITDSVPFAWHRFSVPMGVLSLLLAFRFLLAPYGLLLTSSGVLFGAGWADVWIRRPGYYIAAAVSLLVGVVLLTPLLRARLDRWLARRTETEGHAAAVGALAIAVAWVVGVWMVPGLFQWLKVSPNEVTVERPYITHNIAFTRTGFGLDDVEDREYPVTDDLDESTFSENEHILSEIRLWDSRALAAVYRQFQEIRLYYEMQSVDIDRYVLGDRYRQVMLAAREMEPGNLPRTSQTFVNRRFKYTHGYGITMSPVNEFRLEGLPEMFIRDVPPQSSYTELEIERPEIYFGERTHGHVIANSHEQEFDYPSGNTNVYTHYSGNGGVPITNFWRRLIFGWKFDGTKLLVSTYVRPESRILFHRQIRDRVETLAPFLEFDDDPYVVVSEGRIYWIIDGYTISDRYPYSEPFSSEEQIDLPGGEHAARGQSIELPRELDGANYLRNSVKAVVDAYEGSVDFYVFEPEDPLIRAWSRAFPGLFKARSSMPTSLERHVRYPEGLLLAQALVYAKYHMTDPEVFYNQEDLWVRATEKYYDEVQPVDPYYVMWEPSGSERAEFVLMQPFTPKNRQVLIGWIAGMCDPPNYGRLHAYHFPKEKRVLGTQQVDTKIDQDPVLSAQITLWNQEGKRVVRGNVLVIPINDTLLYVEPIYIQADVAAYPELRMVVVMQNDRMSYAPTFPEAVKGLIDAASEKQLVAGRLEEDLPPEQWAAAEREFEAWLQATIEGRFEEAGKSLERLREIFAGRPAPDR